MLYNHFVVCMVTCAIFALINMIHDQLWQYLILPIGIIVWGIFKFFDANDREYLRRMGIDPDEFNAFFPEYYDTTFNNARNNTTKHTTVHTPSTPTREGNTIRWDRVEDAFDSNLFKGHTSYESYKPKTNITWQNPIYKGMVKKCKRNFKITVSEDESKKDGKSVFHNTNSFGWGN